jgi:hypothetical protein
MVGNTARLAPTRSRDGRAGHQGGAQPTWGCLTTLPRRKQRIPVRTAHDQRLAIVSVCALQEKVRVNAGRGANMIASSFAFWIVHPAPANVSQLTRIAGRLEAR